MLDSMPKRENIPDDAKYNVMHQGRIVAMYCRHCGRFSKGASQHYTKEHTGTRSLFPYQGTIAAAPTQHPLSLPLSSLKPLAFHSPPAITASLTAHSPEVDLTNVPVISSSSFLCRQEVSYDLGTPTSRTLNANLALHNDQQELFSSDDNSDAIIQMLLNEYGG
jgi:hypothetical protein